ncbi:MAG: hypothetical protein KAT65_05240, partial [Methanophagales archaeon]|nr:hypothetical protein [Methanophagales archaeon]
MCSPVERVKNFLEEEEEEGLLENGEEVRACEKIYNALDYVFVTNSAVGKHKKVPLQLPSIFGYTNTPRS